MKQDIFGDITVVQDLFQNSEELLLEVEDLMNRGSDFLDAIQDVCSWHRIEVEQLIPMLKRSKIWVRIQEEAVSLRMIRAPKTRGRSKSSAKAAKSRTGIRSFPYDATSAH